MKVLFDFRSYQISARRGIGRYFLSLYDALVRLSGIEPYILVSNKYSMDLPESVVESSTVYLLESWEDYNIDERFDFFFKGNFFDGCVSVEEDFPCCVIACCDSIVGIMYDLIPLMFAKNYLSGIEERKTYAGALTRLKLASHLFAISECSRQDSINLLGINDADITTIYGSTDEKKFTTKNSNKKYLAEDRTNNLVCVPGDDLRKNYTGAVRAFCMAYVSGKIPNDAKLYLVCRASKGFEENVCAELDKFSGIKLGEQVIITNYIPDDLMLILLSGARASIFPSFYEGLGLPILESYIAGTPAIGSALSSTKDLLLPECSFDPYNDEEMVQAIVRIYSDEKLCQKSLDFGKDILNSTYNWDNSARIVLDKLRSLKKQDKKIAVFSTLPPDKSGIAGYSYKLFSPHPDKYDLFGNIDSLSDYNALLGDEGANVFPYSMYEYLRTRRDYVGKIFVFGNSEHHDVALTQAIKTRGERGRFAYLHEACIIGCFVSKFPDIKSFLKKWYPFIAKELDEGDVYQVMRKHKLCGIRPLIEMTGIRDFFVNNETAKSMIQAEVGKLCLGECNIHVFFHPIPDLSKIEKKVVNGVGDADFVIGSFGIPHLEKRSDDLIRAVNLLNKSGHKIKLLLAGYNAQSSVESFDLNKTNVCIYDNPTDDELLQLMKSVDAAVQLRLNPKGESSGCIAQLLGMGQNLITQNGFVASDFEEFCTLISPGATVEEIAAAILIVKESECKKNSAALTKQYSFDKLARKIIALVEEN